MRKGGRREDNLTNDVTKFRLDENNELICLNLENRFVNKSGDTKNITDIEQPINSNNWTGFRFMDATNILAKIKLQIPRRINKKQLSNNNLIVKKERKFKQEKQERFNTIQMICPKHSKPIGYFAISENIRQADENTFRCEECIQQQPGSKVDPNEKLISVKGTMEDKKSEYMFMRKKICKNVEKVVHLHHTEVNEFNQQINELIEELVKRLIIIKHVNFKLLETWIKENEQQINKHFFTENNTKTMYDLSQIISNPASTPQQVKKYFDSYLKQIRTVDLISSLRYNPENINFFKGYLSQIAGVVKEFDTSFSPNAIKFFSSRSSVNIDGQMKNISQQFVQQQSNYFDFMLKRCSEIKMKSQPEFNLPANTKPNIIEEFLKFRPKELTKQHNLDVPTQIPIKIEASKFDKIFPTELKKKIIINLNKNASSPSPRSQQIHTSSQEPQFGQNQQAYRIINNCSQNSPLIVNSSPESSGHMTNQRHFLRQDKINIQRERKEEGLKSPCQQNNREVPTEIKNSANSQELIGRTYPQQTEIQEPQQSPHIQTQQNSNGMNTPTQKNPNLHSLHQQKGTPILSTPFSNLESPLSYPQSHSSYQYHKYYDVQIPSYSPCQRQEELSSLANDEKLRDSNRIAPEDNHSLNNEKDQNVNSSKAVNQLTETVQLCETKESIERQADKQGSSEKEIQQVTFCLNQGQTDQLALAETFSEQIPNIEDDNSQIPQINLGNEIDPSKEYHLQNEINLDENVVMDDFPDILNNLPNILDSISNIIDPQPHNNDQQIATALSSSEKNNSKQSAEDQIQQKQSSVETIDEVGFVAESNYQVDQESDQLQLQKNITIDNYCPVQQKDNDPVMQSPFDEEQQQQQQQQLDDEIDKQSVSFEEKVLKCLQSPTLLPTFQQVIGSNNYSEFNLNQISIDLPNNSTSEISPSIIQTQSNKETNQIQNQCFKEQIVSSVHHKKENTNQIPSTPPLDSTETEYHLTEKEERTQVIRVLNAQDNEKENERINDNNEDNVILLKTKNSLTENTIQANPAKSSDNESTYEYIDKADENQQIETECNQEVKSISFDNSFKNPFQSIKRVIRAETAKEKVPLRIFSLENSVSKKRSYYESSIHQDCHHQEDPTSKKIIIETIEEKQEEPPLQQEKNPSEINPSPKAIIFKGKRIIRKPGPITEDISSNLNKRIVQVEAITQREEIVQNSDDHKIDENLLIISQSQDNFKIFKNKFACQEKKSR